MQIELKQRLYRLKKFILREDRYYFMDMRCNLIRRGNPYAEWVFCPDYLTKDSVVYSFGVGTDISFDMALVSEFGVKVFLFDPTPDSIKYIKDKDLSSDFVFKPVGLADFDGSARFFLPKNPKYFSGSLVQTDNNFASIEVSVKRLSSIAAEFGHTSIELLKMDIEGSEFSVIPEIINSGIDIKQVLIEFHHRFFQRNGINMTGKAVKLLKENGFKLVYVSPVGEEFTFIKGSL